MPLPEKATALDVAQRLFKENYINCFWHLKPDLIVTAEMLPAIVKGLRTYGGRNGALAAEELQGMQARDSLCR